MKHLSFYAIISLLFAPILASAVGVTINAGQPGFYGTINLGDAPPPQLIYEQPRLIYKGPVSLQPIYLHVPPRHARNWRSYCGRYNACKRPVYFVRDSWYNTVYVPYYRENYVNRDKNRSRDWKPAEPHSRDWNRSEHRDGKDNRPDGNRGNNRGHDNDKGKGHGRDH